MTDEDDNPIIYEKPLVTIRQADEYLYASHTGCSEEGQWWYGFCQVCKAPTPKQFEYLGDAGSEISITEPVNAIKHWIACWLEVNEARVEVSIG